MLDFVPVRRVKGKRAIPSRVRFPFPLGKGVRG